MDGWPVARLTAGGEVANARRVGGRGDASKKAVGLPMAVAVVGDAAAPVAAARGAAAAARGGE